MKQLSMMAGDSALYHLCVSVCVHCKVSVTTSLLANYFTQVTKENLDSYEGGRAVPGFQIELKMIDEPKSLVQRVNFEGIVPESYVRITREPREPGKVRDLYYVML